MVKDNSVIEKILKKGIKNEKLVLIILGVILFLIIAMPTDKENIQYRLQSGRKVYIEKNLAATGKSVFREQKVKNNAGAEFARPL